MTTTCCTSFSKARLRPLRNSKAAIRRATIGMNVFPVLCGTAFKNKGIQTLLDAVVDYLPSPLDVPPIEGIDPDDPSDEKLISQGGGQ